MGTLRAIMQVTANDVHHYERWLELALAGLNEDRSISSQNKEVILSYIKFRDAQGLSIPRQVRYIFTLKNCPDSWRVKLLTMLQRRV